MLPEKKESAEITMVARSYITGTSTFSPSSSIALNLILTLINKCYFAEAQFDLQSQDTLGRVAS